MDNNIEPKALTVQMRMWLKQHSNVSVTHNTINNMKENKIINRPIYFTYFFPNIIVVIYFIFVYIYSDLG